MVAKGRTGCGDEAEGSLLPKRAEELRRGAVVIGAKS